MSTENHPDAPTPAEKPHRPLAMKDPRVYLAGERTLLAWIRTGLALMGLGFVVARFGLFLREVAVAQHAAVPPTSGLSLWVGSGLIVLGILTNVHSAAQHLAFARRLARGEPYYPPRVPPGVVVAFVLAVLGIAMAVHMVLASR